MSALSTPGTATPAAYRGQGRGGARLADLVWLTWRQHRAVIITGLAVAGVVTGSMLYVAARIATINQECKNTACPPGSALAASLTGLFGLTNLSLYLTIIVLFLPLLTGVFLGAPLLAREHEQRTLLLAWSQDITPQRWLWTKFALLGVLTAAAGSGGVRRRRAPGRRGEHRDREELVLPGLRRRVPGQRHTAAGGADRGVARRRRGTGRRVPPHPARHLHRAHRVHRRPLPCRVAVSDPHDAADSPGPHQRQLRTSPPGWAPTSWSSTGAWTRSTTRPATP